MVIRQYQQINLINTGSTTYELEVAKVLNIKTDRSEADVRADIKRELLIPDYKIGKYIYFNKKEWLIEKDLLDSTFEQWIQLEILINKQDNINNLHRLLAIYLRPIRKSKILKRKEIEPYNLEKQEAIANELLDLPLEIAKTLMIFFYQFVVESLNNMKITYLNKMTEQINLSTKIKQTYSIG